MILVQRKAQQKFISWGRNPLSIVNCNVCYLNMGHVTIYLVLDRNLLNGCKSWGIGIQDSKKAHSPRSV